MKTSSLMIYREHICHVSKSLPSMRCITTQTIDAADDPVYDIGHKMEVYSC